MQAADEQLAQVGKLGSLPSDKAPVSLSVPASASLSAIAPSDRVSATTLRLEALGVNAKEIFREVGLSPEFLTVAAVESGFNPRALSPKGARGIWQLMPATARRYGLRVGEWTDDRLNPELETRAAAHYLRDLYHRFQDWPLALAAYNAGEDRVQRAMERNGVTDFWTLRQQHLLPEETRNYVPTVLGTVFLLDNGTMRARWKRPFDLKGKGIEIFAETDNNH